MVIKKPLRARLFGPDKPPPTTARAHTSPDPAKWVHDTATTSDLLERSALLIKQRESASDTTELDPANLPMTTLAVLGGAYARFSAFSGCHICSKILRLEDLEGDPSAALDRLQSVIFDVPALVMRALARGDDRPRFWLPLWDDEAMSLRSRLAEIPDERAQVEALIEEPWYAVVLIQFYASIIIEAGRRLATESKHQDVDPSLRRFVARYHTERPMQDVLRRRPDQLGESRIVMGRVLRASTGLLQGYLRSAEQDGRHDVPAWFDHNAFPD